MTETQRGLPLVVAVVLGFTLTACTANSNDAPPASAPSSSAPADDPVATDPAPTQADEVPDVGAVIDSIQQREAAEAAGLGFYPLAQGGIIFDPTQPLPENIKAAA